MYSNGCRATEVFKSLIRNDKSVLHRVLEQLEGDRFSVLGWSRHLPDMGSRLSWLRRARRWNSEPVSRWRVPRGRHALAGHQQYMGCWCEIIRAHPSEWRCDSAGCLPATGGWRTRNACSEPMRYGWKAWVFLVRV